jgi:uncharacterized membrane protein YfcA
MRHVLIAAPRKWESNPERTLLYALVCLIALVAAALTLFSGFGLGTLLLPAFALVFPIEVAVAATAIVHLTNNVFKLVLIGRNASRRVVIAFGLPAIGGAMVGAAVLIALGQAQPIATYDLLGAEREITPIALAIGGLITLFALLDLSPRFRKLAIGARWLPFGGVISGFFGGLSGHQGALRSVFLIRAGLARDGYVATAAVCATLVDLTRLAIYAAGATFFAKRFGGLAPSQWTLVGAACLCAFLGSYLGVRLVKKTTLETVHLVVAIALVIVGVGMGAGLI